MSRTGLCVCCGTSTTGRINGDVPICPPCRDKYGYPIPREPNVAQPAWKVAYWKKVWQEGACLRLRPPTGWTPRSDAAPPSSSASPSGRPSPS